MALSWVVAGGGTGGHVTPALALAEQIAERGDRVRLIGSERGLEARLVPQAGFELVALKSSQVMGRGPIGKLLGVLGILKTVGAARRALRECEADIVVSVGGYAAMPVVLAARLARIPIALLEPNAQPGRVNRLSARIADRIFVGFEPAAARLAVPTDRVVCHGIPLRAAMTSQFDDAAARRDPAPPFRLLVFGGSQGARQINEAMIEAQDALLESSIEVFHQTGANDCEKVTEAYAKSGLKGEVVAFEPDMPARYGWADLALCRSGALTVAELSLAGMPAILVPYPFAADDHQTANARALEDGGAALCLRTSSEEPLSGARLAQALEELLSDPDRLRAMSQAARALARPDAARDIVNDCARMITTHRL